MRLPFLSSVLTYSEANAIDLIPGLQNTLDAVLVYWSLTFTTGSTLIPMVRKALD